MKSALPLRMVLMAAIVLLLVGQPAAQAGVKGAPALAPAAGSDDFDSATVITSLPFTDTMDTTGATTAGDDPILPCGPRDPGENTVWWQFTASADGVLVADTEGSDYDTVLAVWTGTRGALTNVACDDDSGTGLLSRTAFWVTSGTTYYIEVADYGSGTDGVLIAAASDQARSLHAKAPQSIQAGGNLTLHVDFRALGHPISFGSCNVIGHVGGYVYSVAAADLDQDGRLDVVSGDGGGQVVAWQNDGSPFAGEWFSNTVGTLGDYVRTVAVGDLDGDTWPDVVSGDDDYQVMAWQNDGTPFAGGWLSNTVGSHTDYVRSVAIGDLDGDGQPDVASSGDDYQVMAWQNDGTPFAGGWLSNTVGTLGDYVRTVAIGDLDGDGQPDVVSGDDDYQVVAWQNDGAPFAGGWLSNTVGTLGDYVRTVAIGDLDGDSQPDVVSGDDDYQVVAWQNDGTPFSSGWLSNTVGSRGDYITSVAMGDLDGDGQPDVVSGDEDNQVIAWQNPGAPFGDPWVPLVIYTAGDYVRSVALADLDNDGDLDIIAGSDDRSVIVCENTSATEIAGWVFIDSNGDGIRNPWPPDNETSGLSGVIIELWQGGTLVDTTHSVLPSGWYQFDVEPGDYIVREQQPAGYASTSPDEVAVSVSRGLHIVSFGEQAFTPTPTATSTPTATPTPTVTPTPTMTPTPTATPTATPSPTPTEVPLRTLYLPLILAE